MFCALRTTHCYSPLSYPCQAFDLTNETLWNWTTVHTWMPRSDSPPFFLVILSDPFCVDRKEKEKLSILSWRFIEKGAMWLVVHIAPKLQLMSCTRPVSLLTRSVFLSRYGLWNKETRAYDKKENLPSPYPALFNPTRNSRILHVLFLFEQEMGDLSVVEGDSTFSVWWRTLSLLVWTPESNQGAFHSRRATWVHCWSV